MTTDTRIATMLDVPVLRRLTGSGMVLDAEIGVTRYAQSGHTLSLPSLLSRGLYTLLARVDQQYAMGLFRYRPEDLIAHIVYMAPELEPGEDTTLWLHLLDGMAREAGRNGAHTLIAEVEPDSPLYEVLRAARFGAYARQTIWRHDPVEASDDEPLLLLDEEENGDQIGIMALIASSVPTMVQQIALPHSELNGLVYRKDGRIMAYVGVAEGKHGVYLLPCLHHDVMDEAEAILQSALWQIERAVKVPVYVAVRMYHAWLNGVLENLNFEEWLEQVVMVKQITAGIKHPGFARVAMHGHVEVQPYTLHSYSLVVEHPLSDEEFE
ncbi:MAG: hypothetical protein KC496_00110 [Anaerolineae bacterium]|nr:hypothetical protein [Anaerolineae bacterium]